MYTATAKEPATRKKHIKNHFDEDGRQIKKNVRSTADHIQHDLNTAAHTVGQHVRKFVENASDNVSYAKEQITDVTDGVASQIRKNPIPASAIALGVGMLLGAFFLRRTV